MLRYFPDIKDDGTYRLRSPSTRSYGSVHGDSALPLQVLRFDQRANVVPIAGQALKLTQRLSLRSRVVDTGCP